MSAPEILEVAGWLVAGGAGLAALAGRRRYGRLELRVAEAAHELRGPLCTVRLGIAGLAGPEPDRARQAAAIDLELRRAGQALEDLTSPRPLGAPPRCDVSAVVADLEPGWRALALAHGSVLRLAVLVAPAHVRVHPVRFAQAAGNLVANAIEHGGGTIRVVLRAGSGAVRLEVADEGAGLPAPVRDLVARRRRGRRGHGLAIAAEIAAGCGGRLAAGPASRGARLVLELPAAAQDGREGPAAARKPVVLPPGSLA